MKNTIWIALVLLGQISIFAQSPTPKLDATQVVEQLLNTKVFIDYANSKKAIENQLLALNNLPSISAENFARKSARRGSDALSIGALAAAPVA